MGIGVDNCGNVVHNQNGGTPDVHANHHHGNNQIDSDSPNIGVGGFGDLIRGASGTQSAFFVVAEAVYGSTWWNDSARSADFKAACYQQFKAIRDDLVAHGL